MDRLSMSLDDLIRQKATDKESKKFLKKRNGESNQKFRTLKTVSQSSREERRSEPYQKVQSREVLTVNHKPIQSLQVAVEPKKKNSILNRVGVPTGVIFENLMSSVEADDIKELCSTIAPVKSVSMKIDSNRKKSAEVHFLDRIHASQCVEKFNGLTLDGLVMTVRIVEKPASSLFSITSNANSTAEAVPMKPNVRDGIFGTAMSTLDNPPANTTVFSVNLGNGASAFKTNNRGNGSRRMEKSQKIIRPGQQNGHKKKDSEPVDLDSVLDNYMSKK